MIETKCRLRQTFVLAAVFVGAVSIALIVEPEVYTVHLKHKCVKHEKMALGQCMNSKDPDQGKAPHKAHFLAKMYFFFFFYFLTLVLLSPDIPCLCKQCRSRSVGF